MAYHEKVRLLLVYITFTQMIKRKTCRPNDLCVLMIYASLAKILVLTKLGEFKQCTQPAEKYFTINPLIANSLKTHVCAFRLKNRYANKMLNFVWNGLQLQRCDNPVNLGFAFNRSLALKKSASPKRKLKSQHVLTA